jgi:hypothetical protein
MDRTDDFMAAIVRMRGDVEQLKRLGVSRWGAANPNTAWGRVALATKTAAQNGFTSTIADISSLTVTFTAVANRIYRTTLHLPVRTGMTRTVVPLSPTSLPSRKGCHMTQDEPVDEDAAYLAKMEAQRAEADALLADPDVHTPTDEVDGDETLSDG